MGLEKDPLVDEMMQEESLTREILERLSEPFPEEAIEWKPQRLWPKENPTRAQAVPYITSRHIMDRLDEVVGPANWQYEPDEFNKGIKGKLTILGVTKSDIGFVEGDDAAGIKGSSSDALKRAGVLFGMGRYLYEAEEQWVDWDNKKREFAEQPKLKFKKGPRPAEVQPAKEEQKVSPPSAPPTEPKKAQKAPPPEEKPVLVTVRLIQEEANAQLEAMGLEPHYKGRPHTIKAMEACGYKGTAAQFLSDNFADIVACLVDRVKEAQEQ